MGEGGSRVVYVVLFHVSTATHVYVVWFDVSTSTPVPFSHLKPLTSNMSVRFRRGSAMRLVWQSNKFYEILPRLSGKLLSFCNTRKENTVLNRLRIGHSYLTHSFILRKEVAPVCVMCNTVLTVKHI